jgi:hypothetical protein
MKVRVDDLDAGGESDITGLDLTGSFGREMDHLGVGPLHAHHNPLDVEDDVDNILDDTGDGRELVLDSFDPDRGDGCTGDPGQQSATEGIAEGVSEPGLQRLDHDLGPDI